MILPSLTFIEDSFAVRVDTIFSQVSASMNISERFGFCYQSYFTRRFKCRFGLTPQQFRKNQPPDKSEKQLILDVSRTHDD